MVKMVVNEDDFARLAPIIKESWNQAKIGAERLLQHQCSGMRSPLAMSVISEVVPSILQQVGYYAKQYSTLLFDRHSNATFVAILDVDAILQTPVSPWHVFSADSRPYLIGSNTDTIKFARSTSWLIGDLPQFDFMLQVPVVVRRELLGDFRRWVVKRRIELGASKSTSFLNVFAHTYITSLAANATFASTPCNFCLIGNWAYHMRRHDSFAFVIEGCEGHGQHAVVRIARHSVVTWRRDTLLKGNRSSCLRDAVNAPAPVVLETENAEFGSDQAASDSFSPYSWRDGKGSPAARAMALRQAFCYAAPNTHHPPLEGCSKMPLAQWHLFEFEGYNGWAKTTNLCESYNSHLACARSALSQVCQQPEKLSALRKHQRGTPQLRGGYLPC